MWLITKIDLLSFTVIVNSPFSFDEVPEVEPFTRTLAPGIASPDCETIFPVMIIDLVSCANTAG
jgi:hypothetical protein